MAPNDAVIDLTGDDADAPRSSTQGRPTSQMASSNGRKPAANYLKRDPKSASTPNSSQRASNPTREVLSLDSPPSKNPRANSGHTLNGSSQQSSRFPASQMQSTQKRSSRENGYDPAKRSRTPKRSSQHRQSQTIELSDSGSEGEKPRKEFVMPRGYEPKDLEKPSGLENALRSPFNGNSLPSRKRLFEHDSQLESSLNRSSPFKKQKLGKQDSDSRSDSNSQVESHRSASRRHETVRKAGRRSTPSPRTSRKRDEIDLNTPPDDGRAQRTEQNVRNEGLASSKRNPKSSPSSTAVESAFVPAAKRAKDSLLSSDSDRFLQRLQMNQEERSRKASPRMSPATGARSGSVTLREQIPTGMGATDTVTAAGSPLGSTVVPSKQLNSKPNHKSRSPKGASPAAETTNNTPLPSRNQFSVRRDRQDSTEATYGITNVSTEAQTSSERRKRTDGILGDLDYSLNQENSSKRSISKPTSKMARKTSSEEDQGYGSLSSGSGDNSRRGSQEELESTDQPEHGAQADPIFSSSKSRASTRKDVDGIDATVGVDDIQKTGNTMLTGEEVQRPASISRTGLPKDTASDTSPQRSAMPFGQKHKPSGPAAAASSPSTKMAPNLPAAGSGKDILESANLATEDFAPNRRTTQEVVTEAEEADLQLRSEAMQDALEREASRAAEKTFAPPTVSASALKLVPMYSTLPLANRVEKVLGRYLEELRGDSEYWTSVSMRRARLSKHEDSESSAAQQEEFTSFAHLQPLDLPLHKKGTASTKSKDDIWSIQRMGGESKAHVERSAAYTTFATDRQDVPDYAHYVSIKNNILAPNVIHLHCWPYFGDEFEIAKAANLSDQYRVDIVERERKLLLLLQAQKYKEYAESALQDLDCSWSDVLRFLLEEDPNVGTDPDARNANSKENRKQYCAKDFSAASKRWQTVLNSLAPSTTERLARVAVLCETFQKLAKFSLWHVAKTSDVAKLPEESNQLGHAQPSDNELTCRICLRFNCPYHGQFKHRHDDSGSDSDGESVSTVDSAVATDIIHPLRANYRSRVAFPAEPTTPVSTVEAPIKKKQKDANYWANYRHKAEERGPFYPCDHPEVSCEDARCRCFERNIPCEKSCSCSPVCPRKFRGCSCATRKGHRLVCFEDGDCACFQLGRECDPDLCGGCGVCDVVNPVNKHNDSILIGRCRNSSIQRGVPKHTLLGDSGVHGLGLYACENIKQNDFVGEYKGEIITKKEADRRGAVYEHQKLSYLFSLNKAQEIDSTYFGNKVRFINHAHGDKANLYPRIIMVNTVHRIALYAGKDILAGKELLFDYGPYFPNEQLQGKKSKKSAPPESKKSAPHVRNANLVREFFDVEESEDEDGILRAKAVSHSAVGVKGKAKGRKPASGARSNARKKGVAFKRPNDETLQDSSSELGKVPNALERLTAFNISDDVPSEAMELDADGAAEDDEWIEAEASDTEDSEASSVSERSEFEDEDDELGQPRVHTRRAVVQTRRHR